MFIPFFIRNFAEVETFILIKRRKNMKKIINFIAVFAIMIATATFTSCESWQRGLHSMRSDFGGGLHRTVTLLDYEGDTLKVWEGKFDVQFTDQNSAYWDLNGKRVMISGGIIVNEEK